MNRAHVPLACLLLLLGCSSQLPVATQWEFTGGPYAQNVSTLLIDEKIPSRLLVGLTNGQIFRSSDEGKTWKHYSTIGRQSLITCLLQDSENPQRIYAASEATVFVSTNGAADWTELRLDPGSLNSIGCLALAMDFWKPQLLYAGTKKHGVYRSKDGGNSWAPANESADPRLASADVYDLKIDFLHPDVVYAAVSGIGIVRSTNGGTSWVTLTEEMTSTSAVPTHLLLSRKEPGTVVYATSSGSIFRSTNGGQSWSPTRQGVEADRILSLETIPADPNTIIAGTETGIFRSTDFGTTWSHAGGSLPPVATSAIAAPKQNTWYAFGGGIGLQISSDRGLTWRHADEKLGGSNITIINSDKTGQFVYAAGGNALLRYREESRMWVPAGTGLRGDEITSFTIDAESPTTLFAATGAGLFKTTDAGGEWKPHAKALRMIPLFVDAHPWIPTRMFASGKQGVFISTNLGSNWSQVKPLGNKYTLRSLSYFPTNAGIILGASATGGVLTTSDGGLKWDAPHKGLSADDIAVVTTDDGDPSTLFAWTPNGECFRSTTMGSEWDRYAPPWKSGENVVLAVDRHNPSSVVALVDGREVLFSRSGGGTWFPIPVAGARLDIVSAHWNPTSGTLYVGIRDKGVYRLSLGGIVKEKLSE